MTESAEKKKSPKAIIYGLLIRTVLVGSFISCILLVRVDVDSGVAFAAATLFGSLNWLALALILFGVLNKKKVELFSGLAMKVIVLGLFFLLVLPPLVSNITALLIGFSLFLVVATLEALSRVLLYYFSTSKPSRPLPEIRLNSRRNAHDA